MTLIRLDRVDGRPCRLTRAVRTARAAAAATAAQQREVAPSCKCGTCPCRLFNSRARQRTATRADRRMGCKAATSRCRARPVRVPVTRVEQAFPFVSRPPEERRPGWAANGLRIPDSMHRLRSPLRTRRPLRDLAGPPLVSAAPLLFRTRKPQASQATATATAMNPAWAGCPPRRRPRRNEKAEEVRSARARTRSLTISGRTPRSVAESAVRMLLSPAPQ